MPEDWASWIREARTPCWDAHHLVVGVEEFILWMRLCEGEWRCKSEPVAGGGAEIIAQ